MARTQLREAAEIVSISGGHREAVEFGSRPRDPNHALDRVSPTNEVRSMTWLHQTESLHIEFSHGPAVQINKEDILEYSRELSRSRYENRNVLNSLRAFMDDVKEMKDNLRSLITSCEDENCEGRTLCTKCQLIKSWIKPEIDPSRLKFGEDDE